MNEIGHGFGLTQFQLPVQKRTLCEFTRLGRSSTIMRAKQGS
jgi:hypothetical protein